LVAYRRRGCREWAIASSIWISFSFKEMIEEAKGGVASNLKKGEIERKPPKPSLNLFYDF